MPAFYDIMENGKNNRYVTEIEHQDTDLGQDAVATLPRQSGLEYQILHFAGSFMTSGRVSSWKKTLVSLGKTRGSLVSMCSPGYPCLKKPSVTSKNLDDQITSLNTCPLPASLPGQWCSLWEFCY
jgi:hypothetical protein